MRNSSAALVTGPNTGWCLFACLLFSIPLAVTAQTLTYTSGFELGNAEPFCRGANTLDVTSDASGNTYATGFFDLNADADAGPPVLRLQSLGGNDLFLSKYNATGVIQFVITVTGPANLTNSRLALAANGDIILCGRFEQTITLQTTAGSPQALNSTGGADVFIARYNNQGQLLQAVQVGGAGAFNVLEVNAATNGDIVLIGSFSGTGDVDPGAGNTVLTSTGNNSNTDIYVLRLNSSLNYQLAFSIGSTAADTGDAVAIDGNGNIFIAGSFRGTVDFDTGAGITNLISNGSNADIFFAKYSTTGTLLFAKKIGGSLNDLVDAIAIDGTGQISLCGAFLGTANFNPNGTFNLISTGALDGFFARYSDNGDLLYAFKLGSTGTDGCLDMRLAGGSLWLAGRFSNQVDFDPGAGTVSYTSAGGTDGWIGKYDLATGSYEQAWTFGSTLVDLVNSISLNGNGTLQIGGSFSATVDFDPSGAVAMRTSTLGYSNGVVIQYTTAGDHVWNNTIGGFLPLFHERPSALGMAPNGEVLLAGNIQGTVDADPANTTALLTGNFNYSPFVASYSSSGQYLRGFTLNTGGFTQLKGMATDAMGNIIIAGIFNATLDADPGVGVTNLVSAGSTDLFLGRYSATGSLIWAISLGNNLLQQMVDVKTDAQSNIYALGYFDGTMDVDPGVGVTNLVSSGSRDIFLLKFSPDGQLLYANRMGGFQEDLAYCMAVTAAGEAIVGCTFRNTADFDPSANTLNLVSAGATDLAVAKYNTDGSVMWAKRIGSTNTEIINGIAIDAQGNIVATGSYTLLTDFDPDAGVFEMSASANGDAFVWKLTANGTFVWARRILGPGLDIGKAVTILTDGRIVAGGRFAQTSNFDSTNTNLSLTSRGLDDLYLAIYEPTGQFLMAESYGGNDGEDLIALLAAASNKLYLTGYTYSNIFDADGQQGNQILGAINGEDIIVTEYQWAISQGTEFNWTGNVNTAWEIAGNWSSNVIPVSTSAVTIPAGRARYPIVNVNTSIKSISCAPGTAVTINAGIVLNILN
jgi:uncharacterized protein (DUF2249 family)